MRLIDVDDTIINFGFEYEDIPPTQEEFVGFLKKQKTIDAAQQWISVKDRLPSDNNEDQVLAVIAEDNGYQWMPTRGEYRKVRDDWYFEETGWLRNHNGAFHVTHWMPLPKLPKEEE